MQQSWSEHSLRAPWRTIIIWLLIIAGAAAGAQQLYFRGDYKVYFEDDNPQRLAYENMQAQFSKNDTANIIIAPPTDNVFTQRTLTLVHEMTEAAWQTPYSSRVDAITNYQHTYAEEDDLVVEDLVYRPDMLDDDAIREVRRVALSEPSLVNRLVSDEGNVAMIAITVNMPDGENIHKLGAAVNEVSNHVLALSKTFQEKYPDHRFYQTGVVFMNHAFDVEAQGDARTLVPGMFLAIIVILWILLRSILATLATLLVIVTTIASTLGLAGWMGYFMSTATVNVPTLVMTLAVADCVHLIASMLFYMREGNSKQQALSQAIAVNRMPVFITSATTAIGFLTLNFSDVPVLVDLGNLTALGVMIACALSLSLLPAMLRVLPITVRPRQQDANADWTERLGDWVIARHKRILPLSVLVVGVAVWASLQNQVNDIPTDYFDARTAFRQSTDFQSEHLSGMSTMDFALYTGEESGINHPDVLARVEAFGDWLQSQPEVDHVVSITDVFKRLNKNMHGDDPAYYRLPEEQELAAQYLLLYEMSLPYGLDINNQVNLDKSATRVMVTLQNLGSREFTAFEQRALDWVADNAPGLRVTSGSPSVMFAHIGETNMRSMLRGTLLALVLISLLLVVALRSWRLGLISLLPNLLPAALGFGLWALWSGQINMGLSVVLSMSLGIIVDDTVHFLSKYAHAKRDGKDTAQSVHYAFRSVGRALWITTLVLTVGFGVLSLSSFALNSDMGMLTATIMVCALIVDFIFLPTFLLRFDRAEQQKGSLHET
ncbi:MMPL family transporter [Aestuariibacter halophilus]|uniref:MMPL family transporter n=1 Tax=Fluctibacter halophilus TaxID=226011 RepID=A0ABS8G3H4_9ALTE|nr:MMPL family transporter [Aestuariibacter halophilus]MCC2614681.1 MMPL family transporter [Aestuariibacter halophilus]